MANTVVIDLEGYSDTVERNLVLFQPITVLEDPILGQIWPRGTGCG